MIDFSKVIGFDWDVGNARKNDRHDVAHAEAEQVFIDAHNVMSADIKHSSSEQRFHVLGVTADARLLHVTFTFREANTLIRIISVRDMSRAERKIYENQS
jgi:uncharacterized DUF497 family protein